MRHPVGITFCRIYLKPIYTNLSMYGILSGHEDTFNVFLIKSILEVLFI